MPIQGIPHAVDWIEFLNDRLERTTDPADIQKLTVFIDHLAGEYAHDWDSTMDTMLGPGVSRSRGGGAMLDMLGTPGADGTHELTNHDRRAFYEGMVAAGGEASFKFVAMDTQRCFVGEDTYWDARTETRHITDPVATPELPQWLLNERKSP